MATVNTSTRSLTTWMRWQILLGGILVLASGVPLFIGTEHTDLYFAWTINPPLLTAAFLGAMYWASSVIAFLAIREKSWSQARLAVYGPLLFTFTTLIVTLLHFDRFHLNSPDLITRIFTWGWLVVYAGVPLSQSLALIRQLRSAGGDPARVAPLPKWLQIYLALFTLIVLSLGLGLFFAPLSFSAVWPWSLTALTGRAIAAWLFGLGVMSGGAVWENDLLRIRAMLAGFVAFSLLLLIALARYTGDVSWSDLRLWLYVLMLISLLAVGAIGWLQSRRFTTTAP